MAWSFHSISLCWEVIAGFLMLVGTPPPKSIRRRAGQGRRRRPARPLRGTTSGGRAVDPSARPSSVSEGARR